ncbi:MAG: hypothetical protein LQ342_000022 [Letrouitia transgressa]|nr:MAG: hypothetical protein LQ342_000022 [Letrouitia transgressa]
MPSNGSSDSISSVEYRDNQDTLSSLSARQSLSPTGLNNNITDSPKSSRRDSMVRFKEPEDIQLTPRDPGTPLPGASSGNTNSQVYIQQLEERIELLDSRLQGLEYRRATESSEKGDDCWSDRSSLSTDPQWMTWQEYLEPTTKATNILEVLVQKPHTNARRKSAAGKPVAENSAHVTSKTTSNPKKNIERIRIRSPHLIEALKTVTEQNFPNNSCHTIHRPFKILLFYADAIEDYLVELQELFHNQSFCPLGVRCRGYVSIDDTPQNSGVGFQLPKFDKIARPSRTNSFDMISDVKDHNVKEYDSSPREHRISDTSKMAQTRVRSPTEPANLYDEDCKHELSDDLISQKETIIHLRALLQFMSEEMQDIFAQHRRLRSSEATTVTFQDLWHLYHAGDLVVTEEETNPNIYRVSIVPTCDLFSSRRPVKKVKLKSDGSHQQVESVYKEESIRSYNIDLFSFDFDGQHFGPVESRFIVASYEGEKQITDLPLYPLRFRKDADEIKARMLERGAKFRDLCNIQHCEYTGLSVVEPREQIDSQVIVDINLHCRKFPECAPRFGLKSWVEDAERIVNESCGVPGCTECFKERRMFDDHRIDRQRTVEYVKSNGNLLRKIDQNEELSDDILMLLPNRVFGFVLRSRKWFALEVDSIRPIERHNEGFEALILPQGFARLVEGLVQAHGPKNSDNLSDDGLETMHQVDLVRGKGKGLIILLHGAPGVGKTSTAECVADYTHRPLFPVTCGDIGETAKEVEQNLEQNFSLAHRWGCVLLLDEADVFLQARDKEDMRRNSVVSIFLRVLEYYPGILFLTTNKVGYFDEAFKSRIHLILYYPPLDKRSTLKVWKMNLRRLVENKKNFDVDRKAIEEYARQHFNELREASRPTWNGRQIKNAFQTAIALAEFDAKTKQQSRPTLSPEHFDVVARASDGFDEYIARIHGTDADRARREGQRDDDIKGSRSTQHMFPKSAKKYEYSSSSSSEDSDTREKSRRKEKKSKKKTEERSRSKAKRRSRDKDSDSDESSSD